MVEKRVVDYLLEGKKRGFSVQLLSHKLVENGWDEATVKEAVDFIEKQSPQASIEKNIPSVDLRINNQVAQKNSLPTEKTQFNMQTRTEIKESIKPSPTTRSSDEVPGRIHLEQEGELGTFKKIGLAIAHPGQLFDKTQNDKFWQGLKHIWTISLVPFVLLFGIIMFLFSFVTSTITQMGLPESTLIFGSPISELTTLTFKVLGVFTAGLVVLIFLAIPVLMIISAGILHLFAKIFKGQGGYSKSFNAIAYGSTPQILFFFIPAIGLWSIVIEILGIARYHKISNGKAFLILLATMVFYVIVFAALMLILGVKLPINGAA